MKAKEVREMATSDLIDRLEIENRAFEKLKFSHGISQLESPLHIRVKRRLIARLKTEINARNTK
jgi:large subunit ribosomal protein L29